ncbi:adenylyl-sulfate kinase [Gangjinia marincola]|uniref:Adenylyl-sulfate kinase n=1 Tax=Gangjinia marincola TaxID=578463 RepID=A0ABP3XTP1_9FLAO
MQRNIVQHQFKVSQQDREDLNGHPGMLIWFTGLSGSGKSTIANIVEQRLVSEKIHTFILDGDNIRHGLNKDLSFSPADRTENIRRIAEVGNLMVDAGLITLAAFVSPYKKDRDDIRTIVGDERFLEIYIDTPVEECERRDTKGLYEKARKGEIENMTGISAPYEAPDNPDLTIKTETESPEESAEKVMVFILQKLKKTNHE